MWCIGGKRPDGLCGALEANTVPIVQVRSFESI